MTRDFLWLNCQDGNHEWKSTGGKNAGCELGDACGCSVPVYECARCGDCDYGANDEAEEVRTHCRETQTTNIPPLSLAPIIPGRWHN